MSMQDADADCGGLFRLWLFIFHFGLRRLSSEVFRQVQEDEHGRSRAGLLGLLPAFFRFGSEIFGARLHFG
jgi:hypothetical protein